MTTVRRLGPRTSTDEEAKPGHHRSGSTAGRGKKGTAQASRPFPAAMRGGGGGGPTGKKTHRRRCALQARPLSKAASMALRSAYLRFVTMDLFTFGLARATGSMVGGAPPDGRRWMSSAGVMVDSRRRRRRYLLRAAWLRRLLGLGGRAALTVIVREEAVGR